MQFHLGVESNALEPKNVTQLREAKYRSSYWPQWSCGQGNVFTGVCDSVHRGRGDVCLSACWDTTPPGNRHPPGADTPQSRHPQEQTTPPGVDTPQELTPPWGHPLIYAAEFGGHLFYDLFVQGWGGHGSLGNPPGSATDQITEHVKPDELGSLARDLDIDEAVYSHITVPKDRVYKVCNFVSFSECKFSKKTI